MSVTKHWGNRYLSIRKIGSGQFGTAYKVKDNTIPEGHGLSIKVLKEIPVANMDQDEIDECTREGKLLSKLCSPGIVQFFDSFCYGDLYCIITEFCEGGDLNQVIVLTKKQGARLEEKRIMRWFIQIMLALNYIHTRKILHRDLKTRNIFLKNDNVKIGDFGISRILNCTMDMASTFVGTPFYMSPEVLKHDGYNAVSDVWSAGVILYEMCALKHAYDAQGIMAVMYKIVEGPCPKIPEYYSEDLQNIVERVMIKDPANRPTASEVLQIKYIQKTMKDPFLDLNSTTELDDSAIQSQIKDIKTIISQKNTIRTIKDDEDTLTPKQKMDLRKKEKADQEAEEKKKVVSQIYRENREVTMKSKNKSQIDSLPFSMRRLEKSVTLASSYDENYQKMKKNCEVSKSLGSKSFVTETTQKSNPQYLRHKSELFPDGQTLDSSFEEESTLTTNVIPISVLNKTFTIPSKNQHQMYNMNTSEFKYEVSHLNNVTTYNKGEEFSLLNNTSPCSIVLDENPTIIEDIFYDDDFSSLSNGSQSEENLHEKDTILPDDTVLTKFQDDEEKDPYGKKIKNKKIMNMQSKCLSILKPETLSKAMIFLDENRDDKNYGSTLRKICHSDSAAMLVDQLHFLIKGNSEIY